MKRREKIIFLVAILLLASGGVISIMGYQLGGDINKVFEITSIHSGEIPTVEKVMGQSDNTGESKGKTIDKTLKNFKTIEINSEQLVINIIEGDCYKIQGHNLYKVDYKIQGDKLIVTQDGITEEIRHKEKKLLEKGIVNIYVPQNAALDTIKIHAGVGEINLDTLNVKMLDLTSGVGAVNIKNTTAKNCFVEGGVGEVVARNVLTNCLDISSGVGNVDFEGSVEGDIIIEGGVGGLKLALKGKEDDYKFDINQGLGKIEINGVQRGGLIGEVKDEGNNNAPYTMEIQGGLGTIIIDTNK